MSDGFQPDCGPAGTAPMKSESCEVFRGVALNVPGDPLFGIDRATIEAMARPDDYTGLARQQTERFIEEVDAVIAGKVAGVVTDSSVMSSS